MRQPPVALALVLLGSTTGCGDDEDGAVLGDVSIEPEGTVPACSPVTLHVRLAGLARYSIVADETPLAAGLLYAGEQVLHLPALPDPPAGEDRNTLTITAVGASSITERRTIEVPRTKNAAPHANAGPIRRVSAGEPVVLDGSGSRDPDGEALAFAWSLVEGEATIEGADSSRATVTVAAPGVAEIQLVVSDPSGARGTARTLVRAIDAGGPPQFDEPSDTVVLTGQPGKTMTIDATASSPNDVAVHYWFTQTAGPDVTLDASGSRATVRAPDSEGVVTIEAVADNGYDSIRKRVSLLVGSETLEDQPPTPRIVAPTTAPLLSEIVLDGSTSTDPERSDLGYLWSVEEAPAGSMLSAASIAGNGTAIAVHPTVLLDRVGIYRFRLRAVDAVGPSPAIDEIEVRSTATPVENAVDAPVRDVAVDADGRVMASLGEGGAVLHASGAGSLLDSPTPSGAVAYSEADEVFYWGRAGADTAEVAAVDPADGTVIAFQALPTDLEEDPPTDVRGIAFGPAGTNLGDLFLATNAGFILLDVASVTPEAPIGEPVRFGTQSVHRPPSYTPDALEGDAEFAADQEARAGELFAIGARAAADDGTEIISGNPFWEIVLDYPANQNFIARHPYDALGDGEPNAIVALGVGASTEILALEDRGVLWRGGGDEGVDCFLSPSPDHGCPARPADECAIEASDSAPTDARDIAVSTRTGRYWIASSDGVRRFDPETGRFVRLAFDPLASTTAVDLRGGVIAVGTATEVLRIDLGDDDLE